MGWKNSPPVFSTATETVADIANQCLQSPTHTPLAHRLDKLAAAIPILERPPLLPHPPLEEPIAVPVPTTRDPCLPTEGLPLQYVGIFVDDFVSLAQDPNLRQVRRTLLHTVDHVFRLLTKGDSIFRQEPVSLKKLRKGNCSWDTVKLVLGWVIDTVNLTIHLPPYRVTRLWEILDGIPRSQRRTSMKK